MKDKIRKVGYIKPIKYTKQRKKAHLEANKLEKSKFGKVLIPHGLDKEYAGDFLPDGTILINEKVLPDEKEQVIFHETKERDIVLGKLKKR